jgi:uncharacterized membrane protein
MLHDTARISRRAMLAFLYLRAAITRRNFCLAVAFAVYGLCAVAFLAINIPPFQNPDEPAHALRADQISEGGIVAQRVVSAGQAYAGGMADPAIVQAFAPYDSVRFHPDIKITRNDGLPIVPWSDKRSFEAFPNTALYPPQFYLPAAAAIWIGRISGLTVTHTLTLARLMNGIAALIVGTVAIAFADAAAPWIFMILTLPMSLSLMASDSEDALLISSSALAMALYIQIFRAPAANRPKLLLTLGVVLGLIFMARPPLAGAFVLPLTIANAKWRWRVAASAICVVLVLGWSIIVSRTSMVNFGTVVGADPGRQVEFILGHPLVALSVLFHSISHQFRGLLGEFIGKLGWLDTVLPLWYYRIAAGMLLVAALASMCGPKGWKIGALGYALIILGLVVSVFGIFMIEYMSWTAPGAPLIQGVQGRYFLTIALTAAALLPAFGAGWTRIGNCLTTLIALFPVVSLAVVMHTVILRYYLN